MLQCPQSPPPPAPPSHAYPSPRSKSPPSSRLVRKLPTSIRYPLSDITNFSLAQAASELVPSTPRLGDQDSEDKTALRSPIPLVSQHHIPPRAVFDLRPAIFEPPPSLGSIFPASPRPPPTPKWTISHAHTAPHSPPPTPSCRSRKCPRDSPLFTLPHRAPPSPPPLVLPCKKRTKRELADLHWQVTVYRSLSWRVRTQAPTRSSLLNGLMISFADTEDHWTDALDFDRQLVSRLWDGLLKQGCRTVGPLGVASGRKPVPFPAPTASVPFPALGPPIQLESPVNVDARMHQAPVPRRARVSALAFSTLRHSVSEAPMPGTPPKGTLLPDQLVAQMLLRRSQARPKPIRRGNAMQKRVVLSGLGVADGE